MSNTLSIAKAIAPRHGGRNVPIHAGHVETSSEDQSAGARALLEVQGLAKTYRKGKLAVPVLLGVDLSVNEGDFVAIVGQSGSGKSTLLHLVATLDSPDDGCVLLSGDRIDNVSPRRRDAIRSRLFGMIFQSYHLLPELTTLENVLLPLMIANSSLAYWRKATHFRRQAQELLDRVGLAHRVSHKPRELSGGEMQRVAIARSLVAGPRVLLADEPTGNLDQHTGGEILNLLRSLNRKENLTIVMVTHDLALASQADRVVKLVDGRARAA